MFLAEAFFWSFILVFIGFFLFLQLFSTIAPLIIYLFVILYLLLFVFYSIIYFKYFRISLNMDREPKDFSGPVLTRVDIAEVKQLSQLFICSEIKLRGLCLWDKHYINCAASIAQIFFFKMPWNFRQNHQLFVEIKFFLWHPDKIQDLQVWSECHGNSNWFLPCILKQEELGGSVSIALPLTIMSLLLLCELLSQWKFESWYKLVVHCLDYLRLFYRIL